MVSVTYLSLFCKKNTKHYYNNQTKTATQYDAKKNKEKEVTVHEVQ